MDSTTRTKVVFIIRKLRNTDKDIAGNDNLFVKLTRLTLAAEELSIDRGTTVGTKWFIRFAFDTNEPIQSDCLNMIIKCSVLVKIGARL